MEHEGDERQMRGGLNEADDKRDGGRESGSGLKEGNGGWRDE